MRPPEPLPRVASPSQEVFKRDWVEPQRPVVLTGVTDGWPAKDTWSMAWLKERHGDVRVSVARVEGANVVVDPRRGLVHDERRLGEFLDDLSRGPEAGYLMTPWTELSPSLRRDLAIPPCCDAPWLVAKMWLSAIGTVSLLHRDLADNLNVTVSGLKRFTIFSPEDDARLYPHGLFSSLPNAARVDPEAPDRARFPLSSEASPLVADVGPGEGIYIPRRFWHHVRTTEPTISMNFFFARGPWLGVVLAADVWKRALGMSR